MRKAVKWLGGVEVGLLMRSVAKKKQATSQQPAAEAAVVAVPLFPMRDPPAVMLSRVPLPPKGAIKELAVQQVCGPVSGPWPTSASQPHPLSAGQPCPLDAGQPCFSAAGRPNYHSGTNDSPLKQLPALCC
jgi:hypothetical protein